MPYGNMILLDCRESYKLAESVRHMKKVEAIEMKENLDAIYPFDSIRFNLPDSLKGRSDDEASNKWYEENCWYVAVWIDDILVSTLNDYRQLEAWRKFARIIVQAEEDILQEETKLDKVFGLLVDGPPDDGLIDLPENVLSNKAISEGWHL
jgi:hypothetical protein